ncbi:MAG: hypothetical protein JNL96_22350 [Planctomycetaceae bacterium]|nr:hypothetical protein [Planctomycetaceae bacterium]
MVDLDKVTRQIISAATDASTIAKHSIESFSSNAKDSLPALSPAEGVLSPVFEFQPPVGLARAAVVGWPEPGFRYAFPASLEFFRP